MSDKKYTAASTSNADKVIDALTEARAEANSTPTYSCAVCANTDYIARAPLGGSKIKVCTRCGSKKFSTNTSVVQLVASKNPHKQGTSKGPVKRAYAKPEDNHTPTYRQKGKKR